MHVLDVTGRFDCIENNHDGDPVARWTVTVRSTGVGDEYDWSLSFTNPVRKKFAADLKWYLESFIPKAPFAIDRARDIEKDISEYGRKLRFNLRLPAIESEYFNHKDCSEKTLQINIRQCDNSTENDFHSFYWEALEDASLWSKSPLTVCVRRLVGQAADRGTLLPSLTLTERVAVNILLVVARNCSDQGKGAEDANVYLALQQIIATKAAFAQRFENRRLNVQMVCPGTFEALEEHLDKYALSSGSSRLHIVHFDLHGQVAKKSGTKQAFLWFADRRRGSKVLKAVPAKDVAVLLVKHGIKMAVLNSCQSATSGADINVNLAKTFVTQGVSNVLAMSYRLLESAAGPFVKAFFESLLIEGNVFSLAATRARAILRQDRRRPTRYHDLEELSDWIVPVVYSDGFDIKLNAIDSSVELKKLNKAQDSAVPLRMMVGRGFDVLYMTRLVAENSCNLVLGPPGVGKAAFMDEFLDLCREISAFDTIIRLNLRRENIRSRERLVDCIYGGLDAHNYFLGKEAVDSNAMTGKEEMIFDALQSRKSLIVLEGLRDALFHLPLKKSQPFLSGQEVTDICSFINHAVSQDMGHSTYGIRFIMTARHDEEQLWIKSVDCEGGLGVLQLQNLSLADSFDLANQIVLSSGINMPRWFGKDADALDEILRLCDCNPQTIVFVMRSCGTDIEEAARNLLMGSMLLPFETKVSNIEVPNLTEMHALWHFLNPPIRPALCFLALYWHHGPSTANFLDMMVQLRICTQTEGLLGALKMAGSRLWIQSDDNERITYIHPMYTMFLRSKLLAFQEDSLAGSAEGQDNSIFSSLRTIFTQSSPDGEFRYDILHEFLNEMNYRLLGLEIDCRLRDDEDSADAKFRAETFNFLFAVRILIDENLDIPPHYWPKEGISIFLERCLGDSDTQRIKMCVEAIQRLLSRMLTLYDVIIGSAEDIVFYFGAMSFALRAHGSRSTNLPEVIRDLTSSLDLFLGGMDHDLFRDISQSHLVSFGQTCSRAALILLNFDDLVEATSARESADLFYRLAYESANGGSLAKSVDFDQDFEAEEFAQRLEGLNLNHEQVSRINQMVDHGSEQYTAAELDLLIEEREFEWRLSKLLRVDSSAEGDMKLDELLNNMPTISRKLRNPMDPALVQDILARRETMSVEQGPNKKIKRTDTIALQDLGRAYDESDIISAAAAHHAMHNESIRQGRIMQALKHARALNEMVTYDPGVKAGLPWLEKQTEILQSYEELQQRLVKITECDIDESDLLSVEAKRSQIEGMMGSLATEAFLDYLDAYRVANDAQHKFHNATILLRHLDEPLLSTEGKERRDALRMKEEAGELDRDAALILETAWLGSLTGLLESIEGGKFDEALGHIETMESLQSSDLVMSHAATKFDRLTDWLIKEKQFKECASPILEAVVARSFRRAVNLLEECRILDKKLGNRHANFLCDCEQAISLLRCSQRLEEEVAPLRQQDCLGEALEIINEMEKEHRIMDMKGPLTQGFMGIPENLQQVKFQTLVQLAVKESRHADAASAAEHYIAAMTTAAKRDPSMWDERMFTTYTAVQERSMIRHHRERLETALQDDNATEALQHLGGLIAIGMEVSKPHAPEWMHVYTELPLLKAQKASLETPAADSSNTTPQV